MRAATYLRAEHTCRLRGSTLELRAQKKMHIVDAGNCRTARLAVRARIIGAWKPRVEVAQYAFEALL